jgi:hypothetical protein
LNQTVTKGTGPANTLSVSTATNQVSGWSYDAAGNTTNDGRHVYTWNELNQQTTMDNGAAVYHYDAAGNRVMKVTPTKTTYYVFGVGEYSGGVWEKLYVSINGQKAVEYSNGTTYFFHSDHLGAPRVQARPIPYMDHNFQLLLRAQNWYDIKRTSRSSTRSRL